MADLNIPGSNRGKARKRAFGGIFHLYEALFTNILCLFHYRIVLHATRKFSP